MIDHPGGVALCQANRSSSKRQISESKHLVGRPSLAVAGRGEFATAWEGRPTLLLAHQFFELRLDGFGPGGVALFVEV